MPLRHRALTAAVCLRDRVRRGANKLAARGRKVRPAGLAPAVSKPEIPERPQSRKSASSRIFRHDVVEQPDK